MSWVGAESQECVNKVASKQAFRTFASTIPTPLRAEVLNLYWQWTPLAVWLRTTLRILSLNKTIKENILGYKEILIILK